VEPWYDPEPDLRPVIGLHGPTVSINVTRGEIDVMHRITDAVLSSYDGYQAVAREVLRELDIRYGAKASMMPDRDTIEVTVPMTSDEVQSIRAAYKYATMYDRGLDARGWTEMVRTLDARLGAAQAAAAELHAAGAIERLDRPSRRGDWPELDIEVEIAEQLDATAAAQRPAPPASPPLGLPVTMLALSLVTLALIFTSAAAPAVALVCAFVAVPLAAIGLILSIRLIHRHR
jgi:hypothetical protein